ncbi:MAG TPA: hypothetical protein PKA05_06490 [Roseiflexaceae bacterium]|mgnify:CR=1 FL=1|nr:hypothetical protein [Roseiflexaceae bacterium]HMP40012.1 hypothetical protein [Roseiflexaceae bacterium]
MPTTRDIAGTIVVAPELLVAQIDRALGRLPGIACAGTIPPQRVGAATARAPGIALTIGSEGVSVACHLVAYAGYSLVELGCAVQLIVAQIVDRQGGMPITEVHVRFEDIAAPAREERHHG